MQLRLDSDPVSSFFCSVSEATLLLCHWLSYSARATARGLARRRHHLRHLRTAADHERHQLKRLRSELKDSVV